MALVLHGICIRPVMLCVPQIGQYLAAQQYLTSGGGSGCRQRQVCRPGFVGCCCQHLGSVCKAPLQCGCLQCATAGPWRARHSSALRRPWCASCANMCYACHCGPMGKSRSKPCSRTGCVPGCSIGPLLLPLWPHGQVKKQAMFKNRLRSRLFNWSLVVACL
jgi:hypothetical protein